MKRFTARRVAILSLIIFTATPSPIWAADGTADDTDIKYPLIFPSVAELEKLGIWLQWPDIGGPAFKSTELPKPTLPIGCYAYAGRHTLGLIAISSEFLQRYVDKGFSRESLCMALASHMKFDPETGKRLPTYIIRDDDAMAASLAKLNEYNLSESQRKWLIPKTFKSIDELKAGIEAVKRQDLSGLTEVQISTLTDTDTQYLSEEWPLKVPDCFKNGTPYLDCNWRYDLQTGSKLPEEAQRKYMEVGETIDRHIQSLVTFKTWKTVDVSPFMQKRAWGLQIEKTSGAAESLWQYSPTVGLPLVGETMGTFNGVRAINGGKPFRFKVEGDAHNWAEDVTWFDVSPTFPRGYGYNLTSTDEGFGDGGASAASILAAYGGGTTSTRFSKERLSRLLK